MKVKKCFFVKCLLIIINCFCLSSCIKFDDSVKKEGIENYHYAGSSLTLCKYLTVRKGEENFVFLEEFAYVDSFYIFYRNTIMPIKENENVLMVLTYNEEIYNKALEDIKNQPGYYESDVHFVYKSFNFCTNVNEKLRNNHLTSYQFGTEADYIGWINLVGFSDSLKSIAFIGFYYATCDGWFGYLTGKYGDYSFVDWDTFFSDFFDFYEWK